MELNDYVNRFVKSKRDYFSISHDDSIDLHQRKDRTYHGVGAIFYIKSFSIQKNNRCYISFDVITNDCKNVLMPNFYEPDLKDGLIFEIID